MSNIPSFSTPDDPPAQGEPAQDTPMLRFVDERVVRASRDPETGELMIYMRKGDTRSEGLISVSLAYALEQGIVQRVDEVLPGF